MNLDLKITISDDARLDYERQVIVGGSVCPTCDCLAATVSSLIMGAT